MYEKLISGEVKLSVIGLGYVGLPIAIKFARKVSVVGFDVRPDRIEIMKRGVDPSNSGYFLFSMLFMRVLKM